MEDTYAYDPWGNCARRTDEKDALTQEMKNALHEVGDVKSAKGTKAKLTELAKKLFGGN